MDGLGFVKVMTAYDADVMRKKTEANKKDDGCETGRLLACSVRRRRQFAFRSADAEAVLKLSKLPQELQMACIDASRKATNGPKA